MFGLHVVSTGRFAKCADAHTTRSAQHPMLAFNLCALSMYTVLPRVCASLRCDGEWLCTPPFHAKVVSRSTPTHAPLRCVFKDLFFCYSQVCLCERGRGGQSLVAVSVTREPVTGASGPVGVSLPLCMLSSRLSVPTSAPSADVLVTSDAGSGTDSGKSRAWLVCLPPPPPH